MCFHVSCTVGLIRLCSSVQYSALHYSSTDGKKVRGGFNRNVLVFGGKESSFNGLRHVNSTVSFSLCSSSNSNWRTCFHKAHSDGVRFTIFSLE